MTASPAAQIAAYLEGLPEPKRTEMAALHRRLRALTPKERGRKALRFGGGRDESGKVVSNPIIGYGNHAHTYADGTVKQTLRVGLSATAGGISVYILGLPDKTVLAKQFGKRLGKATIAGGGYCIRFKRLADVDVEVLEEAVRYGFSAGAQRASARALTGSRRSTARSKTA